MKRLLARLHRENTSEMREYDNFASALLDSDSYEDPRLIEVVKEKTRRYRDVLASATKPVLSTRQMIQNAFVLSYVEAIRPLHVLEVGGACGALYFETRALLPERIRDWSIVETPAMVAAGASLNDDSRLSFHSDLPVAVNKMASRDLVVAQGVLQYASDPPQLIADLFALGFAYVYVTRTAVTNLATTIFTRQDTELADHGPGVLPNAPSGRSSQPLTLVSYAVLTAAIPSDYEMAFEFAESEEHPVSIGTRRVGVRDVGFLARLRTRHAE